jgi:molybdopterin molybdotransferase
MAGAPTPQVAIGPTLSIITTGDELEGQGAASIRDSNGPLLRAFLDCLGLTAEVLHADDTPENLQRAIHEAASRSDIIVTTGGVSAGDRDLVPQVAQDEGFTTLFHHLAMQPGKPVLLGRRGGQYLVGLPGNPVSVLATAHLVLWPLLARFLGTPPPRWLELPVMVPWTHRGKRQLFLPARVVAGGLQVVAWNGSGDLLAAAAADGLIDLPSGTQVASGALGRFLPYAGGRLGEIARLPERARAT